MTPHQDYLKQSKAFWAQVKLISISLGYSKKGKIKLYTIEEIKKCYGKLGLTTGHLIASGNMITKEGKLLVDYFKYRSKILHKVAEPNLMNRTKAKKEFDKLFKKHKPKIHIPYNKQKGKKRHIAYLTGIINILTEAILKKDGFNCNPGKQVVITRKKKPIRTLARRVDGVYPDTTDPIALWEIKEYYGTTTFGSRVADGVYETMLDGYELEELRSKEKLDIKHYLIVDDYFTWWGMGKSYLCKMVDMLHEGFLDELLFGKEVIGRWPAIVKSWPKPSTTSAITDRERLLRS